MIKRPDDDTKVVMQSGEAAHKKKISVKVPMDNAVSQGVKDVLTEKAGMNVIDKKKIEKPHVRIIAAGAAVMVVALIISGVINSGRSKNIGAVESDIREYQNKIVLQTTAGGAQQKSVQEHGSVGLDNKQMAHDSELIGQTLESMLNWSLDDGMTDTYQNIRGIYRLPDDSSVVDAFYKGSHAASSFYADSGLTVYCISPIQHLRRYACEVTWDVTLTSGTTVQKTALFLCNVSSINDNGATRDELSELEAYEVYSDEDHNAYLDDASVEDIGSGDESLDEWQGFDTGSEDMVSEGENMDSEQEGSGVQETGDPGGDQNGGSATLSQGDGVPIG